MVVRSRVNSLKTKKMVSELSNTQMEMYSMEYSETDRKKDKDVTLLSMVTSVSSNASPIQLFQCLSRK